MTLYYNMFIYIPDFTDDSDSASSIVSEDLVTQEEVAQEEVLQEEIVPEEVVEELVLPADPVDSAAGRFIRFWRRWRATMRQLICL